MVSQTESYGIGDISWRRFREHDHVTFPLVQGIAGANCRRFMDLVARKGTLCLATDDNAYSPLDVARG